MSVTVIPRVVRSVAQPLGLYFRVGHNDHTTLSSLLAQGQRAYFGIVIEASRAGRQRELIREAEQARLECILDPCTQAAATVGGYAEKFESLPWALGRRPTVLDFELEAGKNLVLSIAEFAVEHHFSQVLAPTHFVSCADDRWLDADIENTSALREHLDRRGGKAVDVIYSLCLPYAVFRDEAQREAIVSKLERRLHAQSVWLRVSGCGSDSTATAVRNYINACRDFHHLAVPLVADQMGGLPGLALLALSSMGGIATGLAVSERFSAAHWLRSSQGGAFMAHPRVYLPSVDLYLAQKEARALFDLDARIKGHFGCHDRECCPRGLDDMLAKPARHFAVQRIRQISELSQIPASLRANVFLDDYVRPMTDHALRLAKVRGLDAKVQGRIDKHRHRLDMVRVMLGKLVELKQASSNARIPSTRTMREGEAVGRLQR